MLLVYWLFRALGIDAMLRAFGLELEYRPYEEPRLHPWHPGDC